MRAPMKSSAGATYSFVYVLPKEARQRQDLRSDVFVQIVELRLKLVANLDSPAHFSYYDMQSI